jgi:MazG family protein
MTPDQIVRKWEDLKAGERQASGRQVRSVLAGVPRVLPSLLRAYELSARAAAVGFDWTAAHQVLDKIDEEVAELRAAVAAHGPGAREAEDELGDVFFALANLARLLGHEPEAALRKANDKFQRRFQWMEAAARSGQRLLREMTLDELEALWQQAKAAEDGVDR